MPSYINDYNPDGDEVYEAIEEELYHDPHAWRDYAWCLGASEDDDRLLFPWEERPEPTNNETDLYMLEHCFQCPVKIQCLRFAAKTQSEGIWGNHRLDSRASSKLHRLYVKKPAFNMEDADEVLRPPERSNE